MTDAAVPHEEGPGRALRRAFARIEEAVGETQAELRLREVGRVESVEHAVVQVSGLPGVQGEELVRFPGDRLGMALDLRPETVGVVLLDPTAEIEAGDPVHRTGRVMDVPVGDELLGRVVDPAGRPLDGRGPVRTAGRLPIERPAPPITERAPVDVPLQTGVKVIDALVPIGRGQRELVVGDRQSGKTAIAVDAILAQRGRDVRCVYCAIGQRASAVAKVIATLREHDAMDYTIVLAAGDEDPPGLRFVAPYAATSMAEHHMERGEDVLVVLDDMTRHGRAYRELSLLLRRPPGREAYPGDIFYVHSRLLERATHLADARGGGSLTALPVVETQAEDIAAYIPTNLVSITDGQIYVSPRLFRRGQMPAVDVGRSVSRVGGRAQLSAYRSVASDLRLAYTQFEELERFTRYGARLEEDMRRRLERGRRVRAALRQPQSSPLSVPEQLAVLLAVDAGLLDEVPAERVAELEPELRRAVLAVHDVVERIEAGDDLRDRDRQALVEAMRAVVPDEGS